MRLTLPFILHPNIQYISSLMSDDLSGYILQLFELYMLHFLGGELSSENDYLENGLEELTFLELVRHEWPSSQFRFLVHSRASDRYGAEVDKGQLRIRCCKVVWNIRIQLDHEIIHLKKHRSVSFRLNYYAFDHLVTFSIRSFWKGRKWYF